MFRKKQTSYNDLNALPALKTDEISRKCRSAPNYAECAQRYKPLGIDTGRDYRADEIMKKVSMEKDESQKIIRFKLEKIKQAVVLNKTDIETVRLEAERNGENPPFSEETIQKIKGIKAKLELLKKQLSDLDVVGNVSDINKLAQVKGSLSGEVIKEREFEIAKINNILATYGGRKRKTRRRKTKRR